MSAVVAAQRMQRTAQRMARMGRGTDTALGHLTPGEVVVPREVLAQMGTREQLRRGFAAAGADMGRFTVGGADDAVNPRTGAREYAFGDPDAGESFGEAPGTDGTGGGETPTGAEDPSEHFEGPGGASVAPSATGGPGVGDAPDGGDPDTDEFSDLFDDPRMQPEIDTASLNRDIEFSINLGDASEKGLEVKEELEPTFTDILGALVVPGKGLELVANTFEMESKLDDIAEEHGLTRDQLDAGMGDFGPDTGGEERGGDPDTLPGDAGAPVPGVEPEVDPDSPETVFGEVVPWEGVPDITQAALPEGWLGNVQGNILATHQSAARMGAW